jgi:hypothetical protein
MALMAMLSFPGKNECSENYYKFLHLKYPDEIVSITVRLKTLQNEGENMNVLST